MTIELGMLYFITFSSLLYLTFRHINKIKISDVFVDDMQNEPVELESVNIKKVWVEATIKNELGQEGPFITFSYDYSKQKEISEIFDKIEQDNDKNYPRLG